MKGIHEFVGWNHRGGGEENVVFIDSPYMEKAIYQALVCYCVSLPARLFCMLDARGSVLAMSACVEVDKVFVAKYYRYQVVDRKSEIAQSSLLVFY